MSISATFKSPGRLAGLVLLLAGVLVGATTAQEPTPGVRVGGEVATPLKLSAADLAGLPRTTVKATDHGGATAEFEGVRLWDVLGRAGIASGPEKRGKAAASYVVVEAADGYRVVFALLELDPEFSDKVVILADRRDGRPMAEPQGPFRIVAPGEKRQARWARMVESITVRSAPAGEEAR